MGFRGGPGQRGRSGWDDYVGPPKTLASGASVGGKATLDLLLRVHVTEREVLYCVYVAEREVLWCQLA